MKTFLKNNQINHSLHDRNYLVQRLTQKRSIQQHVLLFFALHLPQQDHSDVFTLCSLHFSLMRWQSFASFTLMRIIVSHAPITPLLFSHRTVWKEKTDFIHFTFACFLCRKAIHKYQKALSVETRINQSGVSAIKWMGDEKASPLHHLLSAPHCDWADVHRNYAECSLHIYMNLQTSQYNTRMCFHMSTCRSFPPLFSSFLFVL